MTLTPDQFDVEFSVFYSGSYTSEIMSGSIFDASTNTGATTGRRRIADHSSGSNYLKLVSTTGEVIPHSLFHLFKRKYNIGTNYRHSLHYCPHEVYDDSLVPNLFEIYTMHGGQFLYPLVETDTPWDVPASAAFAQPYKMILGYPDLTASATPGDASTQVSNNSWLFSYPFEQKYRTISKPFNLPTNITRSTYKEILNSPDMSYTTLTGLTGSFPPKIFLELIGVSTISLDQEITDTTIRKYNTVTEIYGAVSFVNNDYAISSVGYSGSIKQIYKHFFGFGDGFRNQVVFDTLTTASGGDSKYYHGQGSVVRGWKYGLFNAFPIENKIIFSRKRFGHLRDMVEQRPFTKFFDPIGINSDGTPGARIGAGASPIEIRFVSGSDAFITSSVSTVSNSNDSGIYDFEYRVGKPFKDPT